MRENERQIAAILGHSSSRRMRDYEPDQLMHYNGYARSFYRDWVQNSSRSKIR